MSRYVDADAVESTLQEMEMITAMSHIELGEEDDDVGEISMPMFTVRNIMKTAPSIDIVRCSECKHWRAYETWSECELWTDDPYESAKTNADDFCSYGVRKITKEFTQEERSSE